MTRSLNILMIVHWVRSKIWPRPHAMAKNLVQRGHRATIMAISDRRRLGVVESEQDGVRIIETPDLLGGRLRSGWDMWDALNRLVYLSRDPGPYDVLHCFETRPITIYPALYYRRKHGLLMLTDWNDWWGRGGIISELRPAWYRALFGGIETYYEEAFRTRADGLTVISTALRERAIGLGMPAENICHIPGGAFPDLFPYRTVEECRQHIGLPVDDPVIGYSSMEAHVELDMMLHTLAIIATRYPTVKLLLTGRTKPAVMKLARAYGVADHVYLTGYLAFKELPWYLGAANVFVLPFPGKIYNVGRWPNKIGDYISLGRPLVSNPVGDVKPLLENHDIGRLAQWDPADFARQVIDLIEHPDEARRLGENARRLATTTYDWKNLVVSLEEFYWRMLDAKRGTAARVQPA